MHKPDEATMEGVSDIGRYQNGVTEDVDTAIRAFQIVFCAAIAHATPSQDHCASRHNHEVGKQLDILAWQDTRGVGWHVAGACSVELRKHLPYLGGAD